MKMASFLQMICFLFVISTSCKAISRIRINAKAKGKNFEHFWESTGFCPPDPKQDIYKSLLREDVKLNLALIGALPNSGIKLIRIHWLFNLIFERTNKQNNYDFQYLDQLINFLYKNNLRPAFELMGFPIKSNFTSFDYLTLNHQQFWADLVHQIISRSIAKYGIDEVSKWKFETWNEPDLKHYNLLNFTLPRYLQYVNGCAEGLRKSFIVDKSKMSFRLGGPAGLFRNNSHPLCWGLLKSCNSLRKSQCPIQFISFHRKGNGTAEGVLNGTLELLDLFYNKFRNLRKMPIANDEADIISNWSNSWEWRADTRYAAMIVKVISDYYKSIILHRKMKIEVLSNDNAFLNYHPFYFKQRTLFARFQMNHTNPPSNQFIKKPVYSVMGLLSFLGDEYLEQEINSPTDPLLTILTTRMFQTHQSIVSIMMTYANNSQVNSNKIKIIYVDLYNLPFSCKIVGYILDNIRTNPYWVWKRHGKPVFPTENVRKLMRDVEEPYRFYISKQISKTNWNMSVNLTIPSIVLLHVCSKPVENPGKVVNLFIYNITWNEILMTWRDSAVMSRCIQTYEVEFESKCENSLQFKRVNIKDIIFLSYHHVTTGDGACETTIGRYRIRAVDYWDQPGQYSEIISYP